MVAFLIPFAMRAVIDTHVFVGACMGAGACNAVIHASPLSAQERNTLLDIFLARCEWTRVYCLWRPALRSGQLPFARSRVMTPEAFLKEILHRME